MKLTNAAMSRLFNFDRNLYLIAGLPFDALDLNDVVRIIHDSAERNRSCFISTPNLNFIVSCLSDASFRSSVLSSDLSIPDGKPVVWLAKLLKLPIKERVSGANLFEQLESNQDKKIKVYFFGGLEGIAQLACQKINDRNSAMSCSGYESPGFGSIEAMSSDSSINAINESGADFLVVSLGAKKGQAWIEHNRNRIKTPIMCHLGAVINFVAGNVNRAPLFLQNLGFEWLWRIYQEPNLWKRYFNDGLHFLSLLTTKAVPYALWLRFQQKQFSGKNELNLNVTESADQSIHITLSGVCTDETILPLKQAIKKLAPFNNHFILDLNNVIHIDPAFLGTCSLLYAHCHCYGGKLQITNINNITRRIFKWNCADFLIDD
ncbi:MAG: WecB/TagA/CpsF family glycosyltransferase [Methylicorpusculum sp.]|uniref:WecB/TagA/CpsF family glycosyltransferase n=1 Tax=Methylicorpusculum sp. TaxID=2713644 RepID=UPI002725E8F0|nr:WecB/TagA/CpsF family glycosyltransferase [Methylicorpusculum sp.]MDO8941101.1 WecB/TagA/CpsF family glycosyltransferase [Methylicorpusculum sp.]